MSIWIVQRKRLFLLGIVGLVMLSLVAIARTTQAKPRPIFYLPPRGETMLYLAARSATSVDIPMSMADLNLNGVTVVYEFTELQNRVTASPGMIDAVIVHNTRLNDVDQVWIRSLYQQGVVIAGVNLPIRELGRFIGDDYVANDSTWTDGWQKEPFYSILVFKPTGTSEDQQRALAEGRLLGQAIRSTDNIRDSSEVDVFLSLIRRDIWDLRSVESSPATK